MAQILGIDTSNYTTSAALLDLETGEVHQEKQLLPVKVGEVGLRQSDAVFHHTRQLPELLERLRPFLENNPVCGVSVSTRPRNVDGSYMPCFLTGMGTARAVAAVSGVPLYETSHQVGHVLAALYSAGKLGEREKPFLAFHVSGGTTDSLYCEPDADMALKITPCGTSLDLKAGQAIDRVGLMLGLQFPCGKALEQLAAKSRKTFRIKPVVRGMDCCLSGLENQCRKRLEQGEPPEDVAKFCLLTVAETVIAMTKEAQERYGRLPVLYAGGVMSNQLIRPLLAEMRCAGLLRRSSPVTMPQVWRSMVHGESKEENCGNFKRESAEPLCGIQAERGSCAAGHLGAWRDHQFHQPLPVGASLFYAPGCGKLCQGGDVPEQCPASAVHAPGRDECDRSSDGIAL